MEAILAAATSSEIVGTVATTDIVLDGIASVLAHPIRQMYAVMIRAGILVVE